MLLRTIARQNHLINSAGKTSIQVETISRFRYPLLQQRKIVPSSFLLLKREVHDDATKDNIDFKKNNVQSENDVKEKTLAAAELTPLHHRFIPMTRRTLCRKLLENENLYAPSEHIKFQDLATGLDSAISRGFHGTLGEIKALYDPLNPDKETMIFGNMSKNERLDNEFWLLQKLSRLLEKAHFCELSREHIEAALKEHAVFEGVLVSVDTTKYDVLRFWALGEDSSKVELSSAAQRLKYYTKVMMKNAPKVIPRYKRVVLAVRTKNQSKLMLKAFKDIPTNSLEYLLPEGKIRMTKTDKGFIATTMLIALTSGVIKIISLLSAYHIGYLYIAGLATFVVALRAWNAYKNKRNSYLMSLSRLLYFKTVANNRALLALIVDRAEDETFKSSLITYSFLRRHSKMEATSNSLQSEVPESGMTPVDLKTSIEEWLKTRFGFEVDYSPAEPVKQLEDLGLLQRNVVGEKELVSVVSLDDALRKVPVPPMEIVLERKEDLEIEELSPELKDPLHDNVQPHNIEEMSFWERWQNSFSSFRS